MEKSQEEKERSCDSTINEISLDLDGKHSFGEQKRKQSFGESAKPWVK
jgi:hypothetical protein